METFNSLEQLAQDLQKQIYGLREKTIPELEKKIASISGSSSGSEWIVVYDKDSEDEAINWNYPDGITGNEGTIELSPDFMPYNYMRIYYVAVGSIHTLHEFYIRDANDSSHTGPSFCFSVMHYTMNSLISNCVCLPLQDDGTRKFHTAACTMHNLRTSGYITKTGIATNTSYYISKVEVKY